MATKAGLDPSQPPKSWAELRDWSLKLTQRDGGNLKVAGLDVYLNELEAWEMFVMLLQGAGGQVLSADGKTATFAGPEGVRALTYLINLVQQDKVTDPGFGVGTQGPQIPFFTKRSAMKLGGNYHINPAAEAGVEFTVAPFPKENGGYTSIVDPFTFSIPTGAKNPEGAYEFIKFALMPENQVAFCSASKNLPALSSAQTSDQVTGEPKLAKFVEASEYAPTDAPVTPAYINVQTAVAKAVIEAIYGRRSAADALGAAEKEVQPILAR